MDIKTIDMKQNYASVIIFVVLITSSALASIGSYRATEDRIVGDLNRALARTLAEKRDLWLTTDTIKAWRQLQTTMGESIALNTKDNTFCRHLTIPQLRENVYVRINVTANADDRDFGFGKARDGELCSDTVIWKAGTSGTRVALQSYARCSMATVFGMSDQRLPLALCVAAMLWMIASTAAGRRREPATPQAVLATGDSEAYTLTTYGGLTMSADGNSFFDTCGQPVRLTPMQHQLMRMFFSSPSRCLSKQDICETLWPRKEDASETLYTLIRRLRTVLDASSNLRIEADRGRAYRLTVRQED